MPHALELIGRTSQPRGSTSILRTGLGQGIAAAVVPAGPVTMYDVASHQILTPTAAPTSVTAQRGLYSKTNGTTQYHTRVIPRNPGEYFTLASVAFPDDTSSKGDTISLAQAGQFRCMAIQANYQGSSDCGGYIFYGSQTQLSFQGTIADAANRTDTVALRVSPQGSDLWVNGIAAGSAGAAVAYGATNKPTSMQVGTINISGSQDYFLKGGVALAVIWYRWLTISEIQAFTANPWQIFTASNRTRFVQLATGGGGFTVINRRSTGPRVGSRSYY